MLDTINNPYTCKDVFSDLQSIQAGETGCHYISCPNKYLIYTGIRTNDDILTEHIARPVNEVDKEKYRLTLNKLFNEGKQLKSTDFPIELRTIKNTNAFLDRFKVVDSNKKSQTIVAHLNKDGHHFIYPSLKTIRSISVREAARLQSFPDNFYFEGSRGAMFKQIGNAVPPLMAHAIAKKIKELL
jgi:DNA (cytosine-5)-methyltransferase 1